MLDLIPMPYRIAACVIAAVVLYFAGYVQGAHHEALKAASFEGGVQALGDAALTRKTIIEAKQKTNLERANHDLQTANRAAGDNAVRNYLARNPRWLCASGARSGAVPGAAAGQPGDDGTRRESVAAGPDPDESDFIKACGRDAGKIGVWQQWAIDNSIPVQ